MVGLKIAMVCIVAMADMSGGKTQAVVSDPAPVVWEQPTTALAPAEAPKVETQPQAEGFRVYTIHGQTPQVEWQRYLYDKLSERGFGWYMPYAVCQIWQESCWNQWSDNGVDRGLTQQKIVYWADRAAYWGIPGADIWDPYAQLHVFAAMMCGYLAATGGDVGRALSAYYLGAWEYSEVYVGNVMEHWSALEVIR